MERRCERRCERGRDVRVHLWLIDDDERFRERLTKALSDRGYAVSPFESGAQALEALSRLSVEDAPPTHALVDLRMPGEWGLHIVQALRERDPELVIVVLTAYGSIATALEAMRLGSQSYVQKPASVTEIERALFSDPSSLEAPLEPSDEVPSLAAVEWEHINRVLTECDGNIRKTAKLLGMHRRTLQRKLAKLP